MNLIVDVGNSLIKYAIFNQECLVKKWIVTYEKFEEALEILKKEYPQINAAIVASVGRLSKESLENLKDFTRVMILNHDLKLPFKNNYQTPTTLGVDRIALVAAATAQYSYKNVLIIDAGTCITYDFIDAKNVYLGGAISPGVKMRYKALNNFTAKLPLLETEKPKSLIGNSTSQAIHSGIINGVIMEIDGIIDAYKLKYSDLTVILTGGDADFLSKQLKNSIFANPNFLLEGLNVLLEFNSN